MQTVGKFKINIPTHLSSFAAVTNITCKKSFHIKYYKLQAWSETIIFAKLIKCMHTYLLHIIKYIGNYM